jgi:hypothetical protein
MCHLEAKLPSLQLKNQPKTSFITEQSFECQKLFSFFLSFAARPYKVFVECCILLQVNTGKPE